MSDSYPKRRREARYSAHVPITIKSGGHVQTVVTDNVSYRGLFACTDTPPVLRQLIVIEAKLPPDGQVFTSHGMSVFVRDADSADGHPPGVGIQFYAQGSTDRRTWETFINHVKAGILEDTASPPDSPPQPIRRQHPRYPASLAVRPRSTDELEVLYSRDVSKGGMFLTTDQMIPEGNELRLDVHHPTSRSVFPLQAVVRRVNESTPRGIGVEFVGMTEERRDEFLQFIRDGVPTLASDDLELVADDDPKLA